MTMNNEIHNSLNSEMYDSLIKELKEKYIDQELERNKPTSENLKKAIKTLSKAAIKIDEELIQSIMEKTDVYKVYRKMSK